ncbi:MAG TPA: DUF5777 family beta-barrel protein [Panacibacter sp.]|nr:DUF5777 family beta-barrel protein [Panacibacter sp.]
MKQQIYRRDYLRTAKLCFISLLLLSCLRLNAQDSSVNGTASGEAKVKPVKNTFQSVWIIDNQTVMVPVKKTLEFDFQHRMGLVNKGTEDLWGLFGSANIRLGMNYAPIKNLFVGIGITKNNMLLDLNAKYSIISQTKGKYPVSITYYGNAAVDTRKEATIYNGENIVHNSDRYSYFNQLLFARKISDRFSIQVAPSWSHQNAVWGYYQSYDTATKKYGDVYKTMYNDHFAIAVSGKFQFSNLCSIIFNYDQPLTKHNQYNPNPNISLGLEVITSSHAFQVFVGNYSLLNPQRNNLYNHNNPFGEYTTVNGTVVKGYQYLIGFNITRLWNY